MEWEDMLHKTGKQYLLSLLIVSCLYLRIDLWNRSAFAAVRFSFYAVPEKKELSLLEQK